MALNSSGGTSSSVSRRVILIVGPTAVGKTAFAIQKALEYGSPVISCDSRQLYREMSIGTAVPSRRQRAKVKHYFIQDRSIEAPCTAGDYEIEAMDLVERLFAEGRDTLVMAGGSMLYSEAFCNGLDNFPVIPSEVREHLMECLESEGLKVLSDQLRELDPESYASIDINNPQRVIRALEVTIYTGQPFSSFKTAPHRPRPFTIEKIGLRMPREVLYERIDARVDKMMERGFLEEARRLKPFRHYPALQAVGYRELFAYLDGNGSLEAAVGHIKRATHNYAKRQMTWWKRDSSVQWIDMA